MLGRAQRRLAASSLPRLACAPLLVALAGCELVRPAEPEPAAPVVRDIAGRARVLPEGLLFESRGGALEAARVEATLERQSADGWVVDTTASLVATDFDSFVAEPLEPGSYRARIEWFDPRARPIGRATIAGTMPAPAEAPRRFLGVREDLGLEMPLGLRLLWAFRTDVDDPTRADLVEDARRIAQLVLDRAAGPAYSVDAPRLLAVEEARDLLLGASQGKRVLPHALGAHALAVVDLRAGTPGTTRAQLGLSLFDLSYRRYQVEQAELRLFNARPLLFEDHVEVDLAARKDSTGAADGHVDALLAAWRELLAELDRDPHVARYVEFLQDHGAGPLVGAAAQRDLLVEIGVELATGEDPDHFERVEREHLFLRAGDAEEAEDAPGPGPAPAPSGPVEASAASASSVDGRR